MRRSSSSIYRENRAPPPARSVEVQALLWSEKAASKNPTTANIPQKPKRLAGRSLLLVHLYPPITPIRLIESLAYPDQRGPTASIRALAVFGPKAAAAIPRLQELKESKDPGVKDDATQALAKIKGAR